MTLAIGDRLRDHWGAASGGRGNLWHVRGFVDDRVIVRTWRGGRWIYRIEPVQYLDRVYRRDK